MNKVAVKKMTPIPTYRTRVPRTDRILRDWIKAERLAFNRNVSLPLSDLSAIIPEQCKEQLGNFKPTDPVFRKMSNGFNNVSDVWLELMRFIGVWDFSVEQAIMGTVSVFLDNENVRVKLLQSTNNASRANQIEFFCLSEPDYQGVIRYQGDRLILPQILFGAVIERRLNVYKLNCDYLSDVLFIPDIYIADTTNPSEMDTKNPSETDTKKPSETERDQHIEQLATLDADANIVSPETAEDAEDAEDAEAERMADVYSGEVYIDDDSNNSDNSDDLDY